MKRSNFFIPTLKETPKEATLPSHQLMIRAGLIHQLSSGLYTYLPLGTKILQNIIGVVREQMNSANALEIMMPILQPKALWEKSNRWDAYGKELFKLNDRHNNEMCLGATHEEIITHAMSSYIKSYKHMPLNLYQIHTKFRDEIRPRFGLMRAREFIMKDAYSFHPNRKSLEETYCLMQEVYSNILKTLEIDFVIAQADSGSIGGDISAEFHAISQHAEDELGVSEDNSYVANVEAISLFKPNAPASATKALKCVQNASLQNALNPVKTLVVQGSGSEIAFVLREEDELNTIKIARFWHEKFGTIDSKKISTVTFDGHAAAVPHNLRNSKIPIFVDYSAWSLQHFSCLYEKNAMYQNLHWERDIKEYQVGDFRMAKKGDKLLNGQRMDIKRGIELGHIFQLGTQYSKALNLHYLNENSKSEPVWMGCYGIGISRIMSAIIEQNNDGSGIFWPEKIAPFNLHLFGINAHKSLRLKKHIETFYQQVKQAGISVLWDDLSSRPGFAFADSDLIGIKHRVVISEKHMDENKIEYHYRQPNQEPEKKMLHAEEFIQWFKNK